MKRGEIWLVALDPMQGHEQKGRRPVLIVSPEAFNRVTKVPVVLPITSGGKFARMAGYAVNVDGRGDKNHGYCSRRPASSSRSRRMWREEKLENVPDAIMDEVLARLAPIFE